MTDRKLHCLEIGPLTNDGCSTTCMLARDHDGPHEWTRDNQIVMQIAQRFRLAPPPDGEAAEGD